MPVADPTSEGQGPFELLRARWLIEGEVAAEAARNAEVHELAAVRAAFDDMHRRQRQQIDADPADRDFHLGIAKGSHNSALVNVVSDLWDKGRGAIWKRMEDHFQTPELRAASLRDHRAILAALECRNSRASRAAMRTHLQRVETEFNRGWDRLKQREKEAPPRSKKEPAVAAVGSLRRAPAR
jgi:DNA-binding FadR family transcriptional regulator